MRKLALNSLKWSFLQQIIFQAINYITVIALAALVEPAIHGFIAIASVPVGFVGILGSLGVREKIIKDKEVNPDDASGLLGFIMITAVIMMLISLVLTIIVALIYNSNFSFRILATYGVFLSIIPSLNVLNNYFEAFQTRDLNFKGIGIITVLANLAGSLIAVYLAYTGLGYEALTSKLVIPHLLILLMYVCYFKPSLRISLRPALYKEIQAFSFFLSLNNIANYFVRNIDTLIIGKFFSADILGQYAIAYKILLFPMKNVTSRVQGVAMPLLAKLDYSSILFKERYFMIIGILGFIVFPMMGIVAVTTPVWVPLTFDEKYTHLSTMIVLLSVVGAFQSMVSPVGVLYIFKEETKLMFRNSIVAAIIVTIVFLLSSLTGSIEIVVISYGIAWILLIMPNSVYWIFKRYRFSFTEFIKTTVPSFVSAVLSCMGIFLLYTLHIPIDTIVKLFISGVLFLTTYLVIYHLMTKNKVNSLEYYFKILRSK